MKSDRIAEDLHIMYRHTDRQTKGGKINGFSLSGCRFMAISRCLSAIIYMGSTQKILESTIN
jgi:hypothetical protein